MRKRLSGERVNSSQGKRKTEKRVKSFAEHELEYVSHKSGGWERYMKLKQAEIVYLHMRGALALIARQNGES